MREATVDLLGKHMGADQTTALAYFDVLLQASRDSGVSVRKRAVRILWDCCISAHQFPLETEACVAVLQRVNDAEHSIQELVGRMFHSIWIAGGTQGAVRTHLCFDSNHKSSNEFLGVFVMKVYSSRKIATLTLICV